MALQKPVTSLDNSTWSGSDSCGYTAATKLFYMPGVGILARSFGEYGMASYIVSQLSLSAILLRAEKRYSPPT